MPGHLFQRVGRYNDAVKANQLAVVADEDYISQCRAQGLYPMAYYPHNIHFLWFAATMAGESKLAIDAADKTTKSIPVEALKDVPLLQTFLLAHDYSLVRFGKWMKSAAPAPRADTLFTRATRSYARSLALIRKKDFAGARKEIDSIKKIAADPQLIAAPTSMSLNLADSVLRIGVEVLEGELAAAQGNFDQAIAHLDRAVRYEDAMIYTEPDDWHQPVRHNLGAVLLQAGRPVEAESVYWDDLKRHPKNGWALFGLRRHCARRTRRTRPSASKPTSRRPGRMPTCSSPVAVLMRRSRSWLAVIALLGAVTAAYADGPGGYRPKRGPLRCRSSRRSTPTLPATRRFFGPSMPRIWRRFIGRCGAAGGAHAKRRRRIGYRCRTSLRRSPRQLDARALHVPGLCEPQARTVRRGVACVRAGAEDQSDAVRAIEYQAEALLALNRIDDVRFNYLRLYALDQQQAAKLLQAMRAWLEANQRKAANGHRHAGAGGMDGESGRESKVVPGESVVKLSSAAMLRCAVSLFSRHRSPTTPTTASSNPPSRAAHDGPGFAPVCSPSRKTCVPFTNTCTMPTAYWCGLSNVARSLIFAGSNTAMSAKQPLSRQPRSLSLKLSAGWRQAADGVLQCRDLLVAHIASREARKGPICARMRIAQQEQALGRRRLRVRADVHPRLRQAELHVLFRHQEVGRADACVILDHEIDRRVLGRYAAHLRDFGERLAGQRLELVGLEADQQHAPASRPQAAGFPTSRWDRASRR